MFEDDNFAWKVLDKEIKLETSQSISGQDVSNLLQLYMVQNSSIQTGVEKMNSFVDYREAFFKERVLTLMSRPSVIKALSKGSFMAKKTGPAEAKTVKSSSILARSIPQTIDEKVRHQKSKMENANQFLQLKQKKREIEMRLAYGAQERSSQVLNKLLEVQAEKQFLVRGKISSIANRHEQKLLNRIHQRKQKTLAAKSSMSQSNNLSCQSNDTFNFAGKKLQSTSSMVKMLKEIDLNRDAKIKQGRVKNPHKSLSPKTERKDKQITNSLRKTISYNRSANEYQSKENIRYV